MQLETQDAISHVLDKYPKLNKSRLARMLDISPQALNNYVKGKSGMSLVVADKFKELFGIEIIGVKYINRPLTLDELN